MQPGRYPVTRYCTGMAFAAVLLAQQTLKVHVSDEGALNIELGLMGEQRRMLGLCSVQGVDSVRRMGDGGARVKHAAHPSRGEDHPVWLSKWSTVGVGGPTVPQEHGQEFGRMEAGRWPCLAAMAPVDDGLEEERYEMVVHRDTGCSRVDELEYYERRCRWHAVK